MRDHEFFKLHQDVKILRRDLDEMIAESAQYESQIENRLRYIEHNIERVIDVLNEVVRVLDVRAQSESEEGVDNDR